MVNQEAYEAALDACGWEEESWKAYKLVEEYERAKLDKAVVKKSFTTEPPEVPEEKPESYTLTGDYNTTTVQYYATQSDMNQVVRVLKHLMNKGER